MASPVLTPRQSTVRSGDAPTSPDAIQGRALPVTSRVAWPHPDIVRDLAELRRRKPFVHCHTNSVAAGFMANVLLAIEASPIMVASREEAAELATVASAVLISVASVTEEKAGSLLRSAAAAHDSGTPWVLDPVAFGVLRFRTRLVDELLRFRPAVIKANASEILALSGRNGRAKGADSTVESAQAVDAAVELARRAGSVVAVTGVVDFVTNGERIAEIPGGHAVMSRVTGTGCALGAAIAAFLAASPDPFSAAVSACTVFGVAGERAGHETEGPGSFVPRFLDLLWQLGASRQ